MLCSLLCFVFKCLAVSGVWRLWSFLLFSKDDRVFVQRQTGELFCAMWPGDPMPWIFVGLILGKLECCQSLFSAVSMYVKLLQQ